MLKSKRAMSPLVATILLVVFALAIGTATMSWGKNFAPGTTSNLEERSSAVVIPGDKVDNDLKKLQIDYILDKITLNDYLEKEKQISNKN